MPSRRFRGSLAPALLLAALAPFAPERAAAQASNLIPISPMGLMTIDNKPSNARGDLLLASDGNYYFASAAGGSNGGGAVARVTPAGAVTTIAVLNGNDGVGAQSYARLIQASDGNLYGTTYVGGENGGGTVFRVTLAGVLTTIHSFGGSKGEPLLPYSGVVQAADGFLYGTTLRGGADDAGTVYRLSLSGDFTLLHAFNGDDGQNPEGTPVVGPGGDLYGTTLIGGDDDRGTVYRITTTGNFTSLYSFPRLGNFSAQGLATNATGANPRAALMLAADGQLYGTAYQGGANGWGTVFRTSASGDVQVVHNFTGPPGGGGSPLSSITQDAGGNLYGTTERGGTQGAGAAWRLTPAGTFTLLHGFVGSLSDGSTPHATLLPVGGRLVGITFTDATAGTGAVFALELPVAGVLPITMSASPSELQIGGSLTLTWSSPTAQTCTPTGGWAESIGTSGSVTVTPTSAGYYTYVLNCSDASSVIRYAYASAVVRAPPEEPVDGGGGGAISLGLLLLFGVLLSFRLQSTGIR